VEWERVNKNRDELEEERGKGSSLEILFIEVWIYDRKRAICGSGLHVKDPGQEGVHVDIVDGSGLSGIMENRWAAGEEKRTHVILHVVEAVVSKHRIRATGRERWM